MGPENTPEGRVYQEFYQAVLDLLEAFQKEQTLENIRETLAAWYGVPTDMVDLDLDGHELSFRIYLQKAEDIRCSFRLTPEDVRGMDLWHRS